MTLLPSNEIEEMRTVAAQTFDSTAVIQTVSLASDGRGGGTATWSPSGTVACHISPSTRPMQKESQISDRIASDANWFITVPAETAVTTENRVSIAGTAFDILYCHSPRTWELTTRLLAKERV